MKILKEASSFEKTHYFSKVDDEGFPDPLTNIIGIIQFEGGYVKSESVEGNGYSHYYIISGVIEAALEASFLPIFGGRVVVDVLKLDEERQLVDLGVYVFFDKKTPFTDPKYTKF